MTRLRSERGEFRLAVMLLLPAITALLLFYYLPVVQSAVFSFFDLRFSLSLSSETFSGFRNYGRALSNPEFWQALRFTVGFALLAVSLDITLGMLFALATFWVDRRFRNILRAIIIIPWAIPNVIQASIWRWMFNTDVGLIGDLLVRTGLTDSPPLFLARPALAYLAVTWAYVWKGAAISSIFCMAGLATVPKEMQEAARIDGAGAFRRFFSVTLPTMLPVLFVALIFRTRDALRVFDLVYGLTGGGPGGSTETLSTITYKTYFSFSQYGLGSAYAIISFVLIFSVAVIYLFRVKNQLSVEGRAR
ncbi:MAG: carbohydrate ABC transporter permease [Spirochaetales bacterium]